MADAKKIVINVETNVDNKPLQDAQKNVDNLAKSAEGANKGFSGMAEGAKKVTTGLKSILAAAGIITLLMKLKDVFMSNQVIADKVATVMTTISIVFNEVAEVVTKVIEKVSKSTNGFEGLSNVIGGVLTIALNGLKINFYVLKLAVEEIQLAWEKSFFGNKDQSKIKELNESIGKTKDIIVKTGEESIAAGKRVVDNLGKAINEIGQVVSGVVDGVSKIDVAAANAQANALVQLEKRAKLSEAINSGLSAQYDVQAEKLKQIRDNESKSITDRIAANDKLKGILLEERKAMQNEVQTQLALAQAKYKVNKSDDNKVELINAQNKVKEVNANIEAKLTEQTVQGVALKKQQLDLDKAIEMGNQARFTKEIDAQTSLIKNDKDRLDIQLSNLKLLETTELQTLQSNIDNYQQGTQARVDAENAYKDRKLEIENQIAAKQNEIDEKSKELRNRNLQAKADTDLANLENERKQKEAYEGLTIEFIEREKQVLIDKELSETQIKLDNANLTEQERQRIVAESEEKITGIKKSAFEEEKALIGQQLAVAGQAGQAAQNLSNAVYASKLAGVKKGSDEEKKILKDQFETNKKMQIANAIISGIQAIQSIWAAPPALPEPFDAIAKGVLTAASGITTAANIATISKTKFDSGGAVASTPSTSVPSVSAGVIPNAQGIGTNTYNPELQNQTLKYETVKVVEVGDINRVQNKVSVLESRATF